MTGSDDYNCIRFNEFEGNVQISWQALQVEKDFCDVTLACEDKQIKTHRLIISSFSPVLRNLLKFNQAPHPFIYLRRVSSSNLQNLLRFMYQGEVNVAEEDLPSFLEVAKDLSVKGLCEINTDHFVSNEEEPSQISHPTRKRRRSTENEKTRNANAVTDVGSITDEIDTESELKHVTSNVDAEEIKQEVSTEVDNDIDDIYNNILVTNKIADNKRKNRISTIAVLEDRRHHPCEQCNYIATKISHLKQHIKSIHEGERYPCGQCIFKSTNKFNLTRHIKSIHEGERYPCDQCSYKATTNSDLRKHSKSIHEGERCSCDQCSHKATFKSDLTRHIKSIHEGEHYPCDECDYKATKKSHLSSHLLGKHLRMIDTQVG